MNIYHGLHHLVKMVPIYLYRQILIIKVYTINNFFFIILGLRDILLTLINVTLNFGARSTGEPELRQQHYKQMMELIDLVLNGRREYLESMKENDKYNVLLQKFETQRSELIFPFGNLLNI